MPETEWLGEEGLRECGVYERQILCTCVCVCVHVHIHSAVQDHKLVHSFCLKKGGPQVFLNSPPVLWTGMVIAYATGYDVPRF